MMTESLCDFIVRVEKVKADEKTKPVIMISFYATDKGYIGTLNDFRQLVVDSGIFPELSSLSHNACSIGKSYKDGKWYGWSHRAMYGFQIGDKVEKGDCCASSGWTEEYLAEHPEENKALPVGFEAKTEDDCKKMAIAFAESVG